jgi:hypothetical protein
MKEAIEHLHLDSKHYECRSVELPIIEAGLYATLGKRLFEIYRKYDVAKEDQRELESLSFILQGFLLARRQKRSFWRRFRLWR